MEKQTNNKNIYKIILSIIFACAFIAALIFLIDTAVLSSRITYDTKEEMLSDVQKIWIELKEDSDRYHVAYDIQPDKISKYRYCDDEGVDYDVKFVPKRGKIVTEFGDFIVKSEKTALGRKTIRLKNAGITYREGTLDLLARDPSSPTYESDWNKAEIAALGYSSSLKYKNPDILSVNITGRDDDIGSYYYFSCNVIYRSGPMRYGNIIVKKNGDDNFKVTELRYDD